MDARSHNALLSQLIKEDKRQKTNPYALAHYCKALQDVRELVDTGADLRQALMTCFCGPMVNRLVKAAGLAPLTPDEIRQVR